MMERERFQLVQQDNFLCHAMLMIIVYAVSSEVILVEWVSCERVSSYLWVVDIYIAGIFYQRMGKYFQQNEYEGIYELRTEELSY